MFKRVPGTKDILPDAIQSWQKIEEISRNIFSIYNYLEIRTPLIEEACLFNRSLGESTELVKKQMFLIKARQDLYALRPEATASIVRAYIENNLDKKRGFIKLYYTGPMFRMERPQKGRLRQFHHIGAEAIGSQDEAIDIEILSLIDTLLQAYSVGGYKIILNSLGCLKDKKELSRILQERLKREFDKLCDDCKDRYGRNILRILDCKNQTCCEIVNNLKINNCYLCSECNTHFSKVKDGLDLLEINYELNPNLVRGLDYYTRTVFEIKHPGLGAQQDALGAGGRYDNLIKELGGPDAGAVGFAFGLERLLLVLGSEFITPISKNTVYLINLGDAARLKGLKLLSHLRNAGIPADTDYENKSLKGAMRKANVLNARFVLIIGEDEIKENVVTLKDMSNGNQQKLRVEELVAKLRC